MRFREIQELLEQNRLTAGPLPPASLGVGKGSGKDFSKSIIKGIRGPGRGPIERQPGEGGDSEGIVGSPPTDLPDYNGWITTGPPQVTLNHPQVQSTVATIVQNLQSFLGEFGVELDTQNGIGDIRPKFIGGQWVYDINIVQPPLQGNITFQYTNGPPAGFRPMGISSIDLGALGDVGNIIDEYQRWIQSLLGGSDMSDFDGAVADIFNTYGINFGIDPMTGAYLLPLLDQDDIVGALDDMKDQGLLPPWFNTGSAPEGHTWGIEVRDNGAGQPRVIIVLRDGSGNQVGPPLDYDPYTGRYNAPGANTFDTFNNIFGVGSGGGYGSIRTLPTSGGGGIRWNWKRILKRFGI